MINEYWNSQIHLCLQENMRLTSKHDVFIRRA